MNGDSSQHIFHAEYMRLSLIPTGTTVWNDCNPIARLNFSVKLFNYDCSKIGDIQLLGVPIVRPISWLYDKLIGFYELLFLTMTCQSQKGWLMALILLAIYVFLLIGPIISPITFAISGFFFLYYIIGVVIYFVNQCRLKGYSYTQNMVHAANAPSFSGNNEFFEIRAEVVRGYYYANSKGEIYAGLLQSGRDTFMAYKDEFLSNYVYYIISPREICFHVAFIVLAIIGLVLSLKLFPSVYPGTKK